MKYIMVFVLVIISNYTFSQEKFIGIYCANFNSGYSGVCINFINNEEFEYTTSGCLGVQEIGRGKYYFNKDKLKLAFNNDKFIYKSELEIKPIEGIQDPDSVNFHFTILNYENDPLPAYIRQESVNPEYNKIYKTTVEGKTSISKPKDSNVERYTVFFVGYELFELSIMNDTNKKVIIKLAEPSPHIISNKTYKYNISETGADYFLTDQNLLYKKQNDPMTDQ